MPQPPEQASDVQRIADLIRDAGGRIVGRTRLQKLAYLLEITGIGAGFRFEYRHYGPYYEQLALAAQNASLLGLIREEEHSTNWGGFYSIYTATGVSGLPQDSPRLRLARQAIAADPVQLELAATAAFLAIEGLAEPWETTAKLKPEKSQGDNLSKAKALYRRLAAIDAPQRLPAIT